MRLSPLGIFEPDRAAAAVGLRRHPATEPQRRAVLRLVHVLEGRHLDGLMLGHHERPQWPTNGMASVSDKAHDQAGAESAAGEIAVPPLEQIPRADAGDDEGADDDGPGDGVHVARRRRGIEGGRPEVGEHGLAAHDLVPPGRLLPRIGDDDPQGRKEGAEHHEPGRYIVEALRHLGTPEEQHPEKRRLEEERERPSAASGAPKMLPTKRE